MAAMSLVVRECQPRISNYQVSSLQLETRNDPKDIDSSSLCVRSPIPMDSNDNLGRKQIRCNFLYRNQFHSSFLGNGNEREVDAISMKNDTEADADAVTLATLTSRQNISLQREEEVRVLQEQQGQEQVLPSGTFIRPKTVPDSKCSGFLRVLARSLEHCSERIAAGFGLSRQQTAWYKHCWHTPGTESQRIHELGCQPRSMIFMPVTEDLMPTSTPSSTTL
ncbi:hypothetical protein KR200_000154 [Drosophila serrata]|nr:hypothetical protein KR200_000154 [Drosophila serrata]